LKDQPVNFAQEKSLKYFDNHSKTQTKEMSGQSAEFLKVTAGGVHIYSCA